MPAGPIEKGTSNNKTVNSKALRQIMMEESKLRTRIRNLIIVFVVGLVLSGITAFPIETERAFANAKISSFP